MIFRGPHGEVTVDERFIVPCAARLHRRNQQQLTVDSTGEIDMETEDDSASVSSTNDNVTMSSSLGVASTTTATSKLVDEADDEGFFDKPAVSPSESGTSTPPPLSSDPENTEETFLSRPALTT